MIISWRQAINNFKFYLPVNVSRWIVAIEGYAHKQILHHLSKKLFISEVIVLQCCSSNLIRELADKFLEDPDYGFLEFAIQDGESLRDEDRLALMEFAKWPETRVRLCFDVADCNFRDLFADEPKILAARSNQLLQRLSLEKVLTVKTGLKKTALIDCGAGDWSAHVGQKSDYMLPTGEIECVPSSVDGNFDIDGWIVGTVPFGLKFGRIQPGTLQLTFKRGSVTNIDGKNRELCHDLESTFELVPGLQDAVELGFGLSRGAVRAARKCEIGCLWHERYLGLHIGLGATLDQANRKTDHHVDIVFANAQVLNGNAEKLFTWQV